MAPTDPFATLDRVLQKYRRDVHLLADPATEDALAALESHLGRRLPPGLRQFLLRHNGGELFRGSLRLRNTSEIAPAGDTARNVFLFADHHDGTMWAWGRNHDGSHAFGMWDGEQLEPMHATYFGWFDATLEVLDARVTRGEDRANIRFEADPHDAWQLLHAGLRALEAGRPEEAAPILERATRADPTNVLAWQRMGDAQAASDRVASRRSWLRALHQLRLPLPWPGAPCLDPEVLSSLSRTFPDPESWERELERFLEERVHEIRTDTEFDLVVAATSALAGSLSRRGKRAAARDVMAELVTRATLFEVKRVPWPAVLELAALELDLGHHDEAEKHIRRLRMEGPPRVQGPALILLARTVVMREEPWAEEILDDALQCAQDDDARIEIALVRAERSIRQGRNDEAAQHLDEAKRLVAGGAPRRLRARTAVTEGDVARLTKNPDAAREAYRRALDILGDRHVPELRLRLEVRFGDLARDAGHKADALKRYHTAAQGYAAQELPVREGWALARLGQVSDDPTPSLQLARTRFIEADLAAGVAVVDALSGAPAASLHWHLERTTEHARARYNAQRSRPPWHRSDADRPERRIGAHRMAISVCGEAVVEALSAEMDASSRAIRQGRGRPLDPAVLRYVASVDLLAGHRSYRAAQILLRHLIESQVDGVARHALRGAVARSTNAALVDGLLQCVERPGEMPATAVAAAAVVLGLRGEPEAVRPLIALAHPNGHRISRKAAITALGRIGKREVVEHVIAGLDDPALAESTALALLMLGDRRGIDFHARALHEQRRDLSGHPGEIVGRYGGPSHLLVLTTAARSDDEDIALGALQGLGLMGDPRGVDTLLEALDPVQHRRAEVASFALQILTGHAEDEEQPGYVRRWRAWWEDHGDRFPKGVRHRDGRVYDAGLLIDKMDHPDPWTRRTAYDELAITTGQSLPFDADGPWRLQQAHLRAWRQWWGRTRTRLPAGRWYLDGEPID